jgi:hypothetical protein
MKLIILKINISSFNLNRMEKTAVNKRGLKYNPTKSDIFPETNPGRYVLKMKSFRNQIKISKI